MPKQLYENRKKEFKEFVSRSLRLPKKWEVKFSDNDDMRLWFDKISKSSKFSDFINEIDNMLKQHGSKILTDSEKEAAFLKYINKRKQIPFRGEAYFSDNDEMYSWFISYKEKNPNFTRIVYNNLPEYQNFDLESVWSFVRDEFVDIIKALKRIPNHGEVIIQDGIDVRVIYDKLESMDPEFLEKLMLHLQTYKKDSLSIDDRVKQLLSCISSLGYIPFLQECRFTDGTDMFTWYDRYRKKMPNLEIEVNKRITKEPVKRNINIYLIPYFKKKGGKFYTICSNTGERLDLSNIKSFEEAKELDDTLVKRGGVILKQDEEIETVSFVKGRVK